MKTQRADYRLKTINDTRRIRIIYLNTFSELKPKVMANTNTCKTEQQLSSFLIQERPPLKRIKRVKKLDQSDYLPSNQQNSKEERFLSVDKMQTKNIPKNYGKGILKFIRDSNCMRTRVLDFLQIDQAQFNEQVQLFQRRLSSRQSLKQFWCEKTNKFAKAFRILSFEFLRKHSLQYIFNSRISICSRSLKYRYKIIEAVKNPYNFTIIKQY